MTGSFGEALLATSQGVRVLAVQVPRGYRDAAAEEVEVLFSTYVSCESCKKKGCGECDFAGWTPDLIAGKVMVPHGATPGTRIPIERAAFLGPISVPVVVEIVEPGPRADELDAADDDYEGKLSTAWAMDRSAGLRRRRRYLLAGAGVVAIALLIAVAQWLTKSTAGDACTSGDQCRAGHCLRLLTVTPSGPRLDGQMCTSSCATDLDCPSSMHCAESTPNATSQLQFFDEPPVRQYVANAPAGRACLPNGYR